METLNGTKIYRLNQYIIQWAKNFMKTNKFNKDKAWDKCILHKTPGDIFTVDIYAHKHCINWYMKKKNWEIVTDIW